MTKNEHPGQMLEEVFAEHFYAPLGINRENCQDDLRRFYQEEYPKLRPISRQDPETRKLIEWCKQQQFTLAMATNPLFPKTASQQRTEWAGLDITDFEFITTYDDFHFTKPNLTYYAECLGRLGWPNKPAAMVGDDFNFDILPAETLGMNTFWVTDDHPSNHSAAGQLSAVKSFLEIAQTSAPFSPDGSIQSHQAILRSTPAVFGTWLRQYQSDTLHYKPADHEWSLAEVLWHLADYEKEVFYPQWQSLLSHPDKAIAPVDTSQWAKERDYQHRTVSEAFEQFIQTRLASLLAIEDLVQRQWLDRHVNHAVFSRTTIRELITFASKHDRLHLRQSKVLLDI
jgi:FMN phosphatase YigB (HAD superfamily)